MSNQKIILEQKLQNWIQATRNSFLSGVTDKAEQ